MTTAALDFTRFEVLTFDCYGTLIDWEAGLLGALRRALTDVPVADAALLEAFARAEAAAEAGPWQPYRQVLRSAAQGVAGEFGRTLDEARLAAFADSVREWPPFADSVASLRLLAGQFALGVITNCDDDLFDASNDILGRPFRWVVTAEQLRSYKPARRNFELALARIGRPAERVLHVAQSLYHDHVPAKALGLASVWIDRRAGRPGFGATPAATATPDLVCPDLAAFTSLALAA